jgi:hypothetical protein
MIKVPQSTRIETFLEGVTDEKHWTSHLQSTGLVFALFFAARSLVSSVCSVPTCEHCWSIQDEFTQKGEENRKFVLSHFRNIL